MEHVPFPVFDFQFIVLVVSFFIVALVYASVGFGGGSSYLAILALSGISFYFIRSTALLCNIVVVVGGTYVFYKEGKLDLKKAWPFVLSSVPLAYLGGLWPLQQQTFFVILGITLVLVSGMLWVQPEKHRAAVNPVFDRVAFKVIIGGALGLLSGLVGIGGGIFLAPILHFIRWDEARKISAMAGFFILVNSLSGLMGYVQQHTAISLSFVGPLLLSVLVGGQIGSRLGARKLNTIYIKRITAVLILMVGGKILFDNFF
jgi:uncharacterized protein